MLPVAPDGRVWLAPRRSAGGLLECPGGSLERREQPHKGAVREVREETGLVVQPERLRYCGMLQRDGRVVFLLTLRLLKWEVPSNTEPQLRGPWRLHYMDLLTLREVLPSVGALLSSLMHEETKL